MTEMKFRVRVFYPFSLNSTQPARKPVKTDIAEEDWLATINTIP